MSTTSSAASNDASAVIPNHSTQGSTETTSSMPLNNTTNTGSMPPANAAAKAFLAKKMANKSNPKLVSPTDNLMTPCSQKINMAKKKNFVKDSKPITPRFTQMPTSSTDDTSVTPPATTQDTKMDDDDENPF